MRDRRSCSLCRQIIDSTCGRDEVTHWRDVYRLLRFKDRTTESEDFAQIHPGGDPPPAHPACWPVVARTIELQSIRSTIDREWLRRFGDCLLSLGSLLTPIPFPSNNPGLLDVDLDQADEHCTKFLGAQADHWSDVPAPSRHIFPLPGDIVDLIYGFLDDYQDVLSFQKVTFMNPSARVWLALGQKYRIFEDSNFAVGTLGEIASKILHALWNVHHYPSKFPHAANYDVLRQNTKVVLACMPDRALGSDTDIDPSRFYDIPPRFRNICIRRKTPDLITAPEIILRFRQVGSRSFLCGLTIGDTTTGYVGNSQKKMNSQDLCGLRIMSDPHGIRSIQCKYNAVWRRCWHGLNPDSSKEELVYTVLEWDTKLHGSFVLALDALKVCDVFYESPENCSRPKYISWKSGIPSESVTPTFLVRNLGSVKAFPLSFIEFDFSRVTVVSAYVRDNTQEISALEFYDGVSTRCIGDPGPLACKQSFFLKRGENLVVLACGSSSRVSLQFFTSYGRSVQFGPDDVPFWRACSIPKGIFCSTDEYPFSSLGTFGILVNGQPDIVRRPKASRSLEQLTKWEWRSVTFDKITGCTRTAFVSKADISSVTRVITYAKEGDPRDDYICGLAIFSHNTPGMPQILGEALDEVDNFPIEGTVSSVTAYYLHYDALCGSVYRLSGLLFETSSQQRVQVGRKNGTTEDATSEERIQFPKAQKTLYWVFNGVVTLLNTFGTDM